MRKSKLMMVGVALTLVSAVVISCPGIEDGNGDGYVPLPANFSVSNLSIEPLGILPGETVTISATVVNSGGSQGSHDVVLKIDGVQEETRSVTLGAGDSQTVTFSLTREAASSYEVAIDSLSGSFAVLSSETIVQAASEAMAELNTYQFDMDMDGTVTYGMETATSTLNANGIVHNADRQMHQVVQMNMEDPDYGSWLETEETYIAGGWVYEKSEIQFPDTPAEPGIWRQYQMTEDDWEWRNRASVYFDLITNMDVADFELLGTETIEGTECYKLQVTEELEPGEQGSEGSYVLWVARDTHFIMKIFIDMTETYEGETTVYTMTLRVHHFNEPATIEVPLEATEVTFPDSNLEAAIRETLNKPEGPIYMADMETITVLEAPGRDIYSLDGLEFCTNLQELGLAQTISVTSHH